MLRPVGGGRPSRGIQGIRQGGHGERGECPTARALVASTADEVAAALDEFGPPYVVKNDGLAAGKGVVVTADRVAAAAHAAACGRVVIEEYLDGPEVSLFCVTDGTTVVPPHSGPGLQADRRR